MPASWNSTLSTARCEPLSVADLPWPVELRTHPRARRLRLSLDEPRGVLRLTIPRRVSRRAALDWARGQADWVTAQLATLEPPEPLAPGASIPFDGQTLLLAWDPAAPRSPQLANGELRCGGPNERFSARILAWLRDQARTQLTAETKAIAVAAAIADGPVSVGDAATRWGSCSAAGAIRYNWRLILAPPAVRRFVVAHELAHRAHLNHGTEFKALEARLYGDGVSEARSALRRIGPRLKRVGRGH
ncbi:MAG: M48 family metallopeptidase [Sphingomonas bacterium]|nr:M48 family metallopeptidase [Sphingomonas bacterium]